MAQGFVLHIDDNMLRKLRVADSLIVDLATKSEQAQNRVTAAFTAMADQGVGRFIRRLQEAQTRLAEMNGSSAFEGGIGAIGAQSQLSTNNVLRLIEALTELRQARNSSTIASSTESTTITTNENARRTLKELNREARKMEKTYEKLQGATERYSAASSNLVEQINKIREEQRRFNEESRRAAQQDVGGLTAQRGQATTLNELKAYAAELKRTMANLDPRSAEWQKLNDIYRETRKRIGEITNAMSDWGKQSRRLMNYSEQLKRSFGLLFSVSAIKGYVDKLVAVRGEMEMQERSLQVLLQNREKANEIWDKTIQLAIKSPFEIKQLAIYTKQLAAYRVESSKLYDTTKMLADISAGLGVDMQRLILAYGQVKAANYLRGTELRQFSEAGINILGELSTYFTELEGRAVSVGDVFERVSRRAILFEDVEAVLKRVTSEGGVFYKMQEEQADTLLGKVRNLKDSLTIMLNDIGESTNGILTFGINAIRTFVENWRVLGAVVASIGWGVMVSAIARVIERLGSATKAVKDFGFAIKYALATNPITAAITAIGAAAFAISTRMNTIASENERYVRLGTDALATIDKLSDFGNSIEQNNAIIKEAEKNSSEYNKALAENQSILSKLKSDYPEVVSGIEEMADGTIELNGALERQNAILRVQMALTDEAKATFWSDSLDQEYKSYLSALTKMDTAIAKFRDSISRCRAEHYEELTQEQREVLKDLAQVKTYEQITKGLNKLPKVGIKWGEGPIKGATSPVGRAMLEINRTRRKFEDELAEMVDSLRALQLQFDTTTDEGTKDFSLAVQQVLRGLGIIDDAALETARKFLSYELKVPLDFTPIQQGAEELADWQKRYNVFVKTLTSGAVFEKERATTIKDLTAEIKTLKEEQQGIVDAYEGDAKSYTRDEYIQAKAAVNDLTKAYEWLAGAQDKSAKQAAQNKFNSQVQVLKQLRDSYNELNGPLEQLDARAGTIQRFGDAFQEAFGRTIEESGFDFTSEEGMVAAFQSLIDKAPKLVNTLQAELAKGEITLETTVDKIKLEDEKVIDDFEHELDQYKLTLELEKLGIPNMYGKDIFGINSTNLEGIKTRVTSKIEELMDVGGKEDLLDGLKDLLSKIDDMEDSAQLERLKKYTQYLAKTQSKRVQAEIQANKEIAEVQKMGYSDTQKDTIIAKIQANAKKEVVKSQWDDFKNSEFYTLMFEDLGNLGDTSIALLRKNLSELKKSLGDLDASETKEVISQISKLEDLEIARDPFKMWRDSLEQINKLIEKGLTQEELGSQLATITEEKAEAQQALDDAQIARQALIQLIGDSDATDDQKNSLFQYDEAIQEATEKIEGFEKNEEEVVANLRLWAKYQKTVNATLQKANEYIAQVENALSAVTRTMDALGVSAQHPARLIVEMGQSLLGAASNAINFALQMETIGYASNMALGVIGWISIGLQTIANLVQTIANYSQSKIAAQVEEHKNKIDRLVDAYGLLSDKMSEAYSIEELRRYNEEISRNAKLRISQAKTELALASDIKDDDEREAIIQEATEAIESAENDLSESLENIFQTATNGIIDDVLGAADAYVDAWYSAFDETGDGLKGLENSFEDMLLNMLKRQASLQIAGRFIERWKNELSKYINEEDLELTTDEASKWAEQVREELPHLSQQLENYLGAFNSLIGGASSSLSGLQKGIQGITEEQAEVLTAYWNSTRGYMAHIDDQFTTFLSQWNNAESNPIVSELSTQTELIRSIRDTLSSVIGLGHRFGGRGIKVFIN